RDRPPLLLLLLPVRGEPGELGEVVVVELHRGGGPAALRLALGEREEGPGPRVELVALRDGGTARFVATRHHVGEAPIDQRLARRDVLRARGRGNRTRRQRG